MKIKRITIKNVKRIANKTFDLDLVPNKPNLLVAPNGFGKSSIAVAFDSMNSKRMTLDETDCYQGDSTNVPELSVELVQDDGTAITLTVDNNTNSLTKQRERCLNPIFRADRLVVTLAGHEHFRISSASRVA